MHSKLALFGAVLLFTGNLARADFLPDNFWPNPTFENGTNLDAPDGSGTPTGWVRNGSLTTMCQVTSNNYVSPTHALAVIDNDPGNYAEWDCNISLTGLANPGDTVNMQYYEMYNVDTGDQMRVALVFQDVNGNAISAGQFVVEGSSPGWQGTIAGSTFTKVSQSMVVPIGAVQVQVGVVSGGSENATGVLVVDDLSLARAPVPQLLAGNIWPNSSFEIGTDLDMTNGTPTGWVRNGSDPTICQVTTNNYVSADHALMVEHNGADNYGEWDGALTLPSSVTAGTALSVQWFELYSVTNGEMRLTFSFLGSSGNYIQSTDFNTIVGQSPGWQGSVFDSGFTQRNELLTVPAGAVTMQASLVSGGSESTTGFMIIDDLSVAPPPAPAALLTNNFWPNPTFEAGTSLDQTNGTPTGWVRNGSETSICQVTTNAFVSPTHALAIIDSDTNNYGEWDADLALSSSNAAPGDLIDVQYSALYNVTNGPMRLSALFFDSSSNVVGSTDFNVTGASGGWEGAISGSTFTLETQQVSVPANAVRMRFALVSGGPELATGVLVIDNLSAAVHVVPPVPPTILAGNFFPNPTFEEGVQLDNPVLGLPAGGWQRGGSDASIDQVSTNNSTSPTHSLAMVDNDASNYGEWYLFLNVSNIISDYDVVDIQWYQIYSVTNGSMRLSFAFLDSGNNQLANTDFNTSVNGTNQGWNGTVANSTFERQFQRLLVPAGTTQLRVNFASGGATSVTGVMLVDDLSVRRSLPLLTGITGVPGDFTISFNSMPSETYTILFSPTLSPQTWSVIATGVPAYDVTATYEDTSVHAGQTGYYQIVQEPEAP